MSAVNKIDKGLKSLNDSLKSEEKPNNIPFPDFLTKIAEDPSLRLRNIFQLLHDMIRFYIPPGTNEYPNDPESINYIRYDCSKLFKEDIESPFFPDRLLANRLVNVLGSLKEGVVRNKMLLFEGPPGSGKSTFLNNFLHKLELFTRIDEGAMYETVWNIDVRKFGLPYIPSLLTHESIDLKNMFGKKVKPHGELEDTSVFDRYLVIPCPSHDHPIIQIPQAYRRDLLDEIIEDRNFKRELFHHKEYEWVFKNSPCAICASIYKLLYEKFSPEEILQMLFVKKYEFNRTMGEGISVYNPGDHLQQVPCDNLELQKWMDALFKSSNAVSYKYSRLAKTNNGIFAIMDVKSNNVERIKNIHGVISDGIHKVATVEETINSLFMTLINPEDTSVIYEEKSFRDRIIKLPIPYVRDYTTEVDIYLNAYGRGIEEHFLPRMLTLFARIIVASRLSRDSKGVKEWIRNLKPYSIFCDKNLLLVKMEIYSGHIPFWLNEQDVKRLDRNMRRKIIMEGEDEGRKGFSGRESLELFHHFYFKYRNREAMINMENVVEFFSEKKYKDRIPDDFLPSIVNLYDYTVLQEVKESMFYYNQEQIIHDIKNYMFAINHDIDSGIECPDTRQHLEITENYFKTIECRLLKPSAKKAEREAFRNDVLKRYVAKTLQLIKSGQDITETDQFQGLLKRYNQSLKQNVLEPFISNDNFRRAIKDYSTPSFKNYDKRMTEEVKLLMKNLKFKCNYTEKGAKQICIYVIDKKLVDKFKDY